MDWNASLDSSTPLCLALNKHVALRQVGPVRQEHREGQVVPSVGTQVGGLAQPSHRGAVTFCMGATAKDSLGKEFEGDLCCLVLLKASWVLHGWGISPECLALPDSWGVFGAGGVAHRGLVTKAQHLQWQKGRTCCSRTAGKPRAGRKPPTDPASSFSARFSSASGALRSCSQRKVMAP